MNRRIRKKKLKTAFWLWCTAYDMYGGDHFMWELNGNPIVSVYCSHCGEEAPLKKGKDTLGEYCDNVVYKKKCPCCGYRMVNAKVNRT